MDRIESFENLIYNHLRLSIWMQLSMSLQLAFDKLGRAQYAGGEESRE